MHASRVVVYSVVDIGFSVRFFEKDERSAFQRAAKQPVTQRMADEFAKQRFVTFHFEMV